MLLRQRQSHRLRQRALLVLVAFACNHARAESDSAPIELAAPTNSLRANHSPTPRSSTQELRKAPSSLAAGNAKDELGKNSSTELATSPQVAQILTVPLFPLSQSEMLAPVQVPLAPPPSPMTSSSEMQLVSDGWNARKAVDQIAPLLDPGPLRPSYAKPTAPSSASTGSKPVTPGPSSSKLNGTNPTAATPSPLVAPSNVETARTTEPNAASIALPQMKESGSPSTPTTLSPASSATDWTNEPKSTLKFIIPENTYGSPSGNQPARQTPERSTEQSGSLPANGNAETGTNQAAKSPTPIARTPVVQRSSQEPQAQLGATSPALEPAHGETHSSEDTIVNPEQNEPEDDSPKSSDSGESIGDEPSDPSDSADAELNEDSDSMSLEEYGPEVSDPQLESEQPEALEELEELEQLPTEDDSAPKRLQVRELTLDTDGSIAGSDTSNPEDDESSKGSKRVKTTPTATPSSQGSRQSVGDEPVVRKNSDARTALNVDRIGPQGDLILAIGMDTQRYPLTPQAARLRVPLERTLNHYWNKPEDAEERTHWGMFHAVMIYDKDTPIIANKRKYNAVAWMAGNNPCRNQLLFEEDSRGINVKSGIGLQGHQAQLLAVFGLIDVPAAYPIYVGRSRYSVQDIVRREMLACKSGNELTFTLIGMAHYIDSDTQWVADDGQDWNMERLIQEELSQPIVGAACGGTHRLMGFAHALRRRRAEGKPITGQWDRADQYLRDFIAYTWQLQNRDGSMSTAWFEASEDNGKIDRKIQTTGHMLEFLLSAVSDDQLQSPQMLRTVNYLASTLYEERGHEWQVGPKGHALRALAMYYRRVFGRPDPWRPVSVAKHGNQRLR